MTHCHLSVRFDLLTTKVSLKHIFLGKINLVIGPPNDFRVSFSFVFVICDTSTASSMTRFMNSSNP